MARKPVSLTVHRNTRDRRRRHETASNLMQCAKYLSGAKQISGYAIIAWGDGFDSKAFWDGGPMPQHMVPEFVKQHMLAHINANCVVRDDDEPGA